MKLTALLSLVLNIHFADAFKWQVKIVPYPSTLSANASQLAISALQLSPLDSPQQYSTYLFRVRITDDNSVACFVCANELSALGGLPVIQGDISQTTLVASSFNTTWTSGVSLNQNEWYIPFQTALPGYFKLEFTTNNIMTTRLERTFHPTLEFGFSVGWGQQFININTNNLTTYAWPSTINLYDFKCNWVPGLSSQSNCDFGMNSGPQLVYSNNEFTTSFLINQNIPSSYATSTQCGAAVGTISALSIIDLQYAYLMKTNNRLVLSATLNTTTNALAWVQEINACIDHIIYPSQVNPTVTNTCHPIFMFNDQTPSIYLKLSSLAVTFELLDASGANIATFLGVASSSIVKISATGSSTDCTKFFVLVLNSITNKYILCSFSTLSGWAILFNFPSSITTSAASYSIVYPDGVSQTANTTTTPFALNAMTFHRSLSSDLFIYGNVMLHSADAGITFTAMKVYTGNVSITSFSSDSISSFAFSTNTNEVWYGDLGAMDLVQIHSASTLTGTYYYPFFSYTNVYREIVLVQSVTNQISFTVSTPIINDILTSNENNLQRTCPYNTMFFSESSDPMYLREYITTSISDLPARIYLDEGTSYNFTVIISPFNSTTVLNELQLAFQLSDNIGVSISFTRVVDNVNRIVTYLVILQENMNFQKSIPGDLLHYTMLRVFMFNANYGCVIYSDLNGDRIAPSHSMSVFIGCPPFQTIETNWNYTSINLFCPDPEVGIPCSYFDDALPMTFNIRDLVTNTTQPFTDNFLLRVIGGGKSLPITPYTLSEITDVNPNSTRTNLLLIWGPSIVGGPTLNGSPILNSTLTLKWICLDGSPCADVGPTTSSAPHFYFLFELSSQKTDLSVTYCTRKIQFLVKLTGIPPTFKFTTIVSGGTFGTILAILLLLMGYVRYKELNVSYETSEDIFAGMTDVK